MEYGEEIGIVIVGGGICGLATALALHRKGIKSLVLERSGTLRETGAAIRVRPNGWRALDQLGVASKLRQTALPIQRQRDIWLYRNKEETIEPQSEEARCLLRSDLVTAIAEGLPHGTIRFGCQVLSVQPDPLTSYPLIQLHNGSVIKAKILIGCDGAHSVVADFLGLKPPKLFVLWAVRGLTCYPSGHGLPTELTRFQGENFIIGRIPIDDKLVYWFVSNRGYPPDSNISKDPEFIREFTVESIKAFPEEMLDMVRRSDPEKLTLTHIRYRAPWDILLGKFRKGTVTVAGDAMHVMGPFVGQGGSAALEDAVVLARCLAQKLHQVDISAEGRQMRIIQNVIGEAIDQFVKERRMRLLKLSMQTYLLGSLRQSSSSIAKFATMALMMVLFRDPNAHTQYYCGDL
ncbi:hypothetical protein SLEP1_g43454 [Rubroshorea leprosula]|uniref:FAD-binding domain-containing protein n=1 Tax=Rubroshorea leprosula TaxID=152421 RepID=A0AAV5LD09_9ROSI|nr:hypothetical protein SLEP1_g43454 [Rubroshorea leprosula]